MDPGDCPAQLAAGEPEIVPVGAPSGAPIPDFEIIQFGSIMIEL